MEEECALIIGIDIGASTTKGVVLEGPRILHQHSVQTSDAESSTLEILKSLLAKIGNEEVIDIIAVTGGGSQKISGTLQGLLVRRVDEIQAIGIGGLMLAEKPKGLIVSVGTGTAMVVAYDGGRRVSHIGGTGVGGGTILGLSRRMLGIDDFSVLENMASKGDARKVDLTVADIVGGSIGIVPSDATASNFGRLTGASTEDDVASGIFNMVSQVIGVLAAMSAKAYDLEDDVIVVGRLVRSQKVSEIIRETAKLFAVKVYVPKLCEYCTAVGAAGHVLLSDGGLGYSLK